VEGPLPPGSAEFENYKKRAVRERTEAGSRAQADLIVRALDALDDLGRIAVLDPAQTTSQTLHEGLAWSSGSCRKRWRASDSSGWTPRASPSIPTSTRPVMMMPAASAAADHTVGSVFQPGYRLNGTLLRPARVAVLTWTEPTAEGAAQ